MEKNGDRNAGGLGRPHVIDRVGHPWVTWQKLYLYYQRRNT